MSQTGRIKLNIPTGMTITYFLFKINPWLLVIWNVDIGVYLHHSGAVRCCANPLHDAMVMGFCIHELDTILFAVDFLQPTTRAIYFGYFICAGLISR